MATQVRVVADDTRHVALEQDDADGTITLECWAYHHPGKDLGWFESWEAAVNEAMIHLEHGCL